MADEKDHKHPDGENPSETGVAAAVDGADPEEQDKVEFVEPPQFDVQHVGACAYEVKVSIPPANEAKESEKMFGELQQEAEVPGFRPGRAPRKLLERKFAKAVKGEVALKLINAAFERLVTEQEFDPLDVPDIDGVEDLKDRGDGVPIDVTFKFEVAPRVQLCEYKGVEVERPVVTVDEADVDEHLEEVRERHAIYEAVEGAKAEEGDQAVIDFEGKVDGEPFVGGSGSDYPYILGTQRFFPEFEEALKGAAAGDTVTCTVTLPATMRDESLHNKPAEFSITVKEVRRRQKPELDDAFAKSAGFESVEEMRNNIREQLQERSRSASQSTLEENITTKLIAGSTFEIPESMIENSAKSIIQEQGERLYQTLEEELSEEEASKQLHEKAREMATEDIQRLTVLNEIVRQEKIEVTEDDFMKEAEQMSSQLRLDSSVVTSFLTSEGQRNTTANRIARRKALALLAEHATITDKEIERDGSAKEGA